jgi:hypothetical protein
MCHVNQAFQLKCTLSHDYILNNFTSSVGQLIYCERLNIKSTAQDVWFCSFKWVTVSLVLHPRLSLIISHISKVSAFWFGISCCYMVVLLMLFIQHFTVATNTSFCFHRLALHLNFKCYNFNLVLSHEGSMIRRL